MVSLINIRHFLIVTLVIILQSCSNYNKVSDIPKYALNESTKKGLIEGGKMTLPSDSSKDIIVYNVIEKEDKKNKISDETLRFLIGQFFTTLTTILTIIAVESPQ